MYTESCTAKLYWNKDKSVSGYRIQQYKNGKWVTVKTVTNITSVKVINLQPNQIYKYRILAYKTINGKKTYGEYSDLISIKITQT